MFFKLVLEPVMEPLSDFGSFGYRPGKNSRQAISRLANLLSSNTKRTR